MSQGENGWIPLGRISGVFGVRGWVRVQSYTDPDTNLLEYEQWTLLGGRERETVVAIEAKPASRGFRVRLETGDGQAIDDREQAQALVGREIAVPRSALPAAEEGETYWIDLVGLNVETSEGCSLGVLERMMDTGAHDVMVVRGERERLIPFIRGQFVESVDTDAGRVIVHWDPDW